MIGTILLVILILVLIGALPNWGYSSGWGYGPSGIVGVLLIILDHRFADRAPLKTSNLALCFGLGFVIATAIGRRNMSKLHDDMTSRADRILDASRKAAALETEQQQGMTDVMNKLDEAYKILDQMLSDNAASGSSTGGGSGATTANASNAAVANAAAPQPQSPDQPLQSPNQQQQQPAKAQGWKP
jgi:hypothetical protein